MKSNHVNIFNIDDKLFEYVYNWNGWSDLSKKYLTNNEAKDKTNWLTTSIPIQIENMISFMGVYRKVLIDYIMKKSITNIINPKDYSEFLNSFENRTSHKNTLESTILINAFGSNNPTSDYDVTFAGAGTYLIVKNILDTFNKDIGKKHHTTMATFFDSNFYLIPDIIVNKFNEPIFTTNDIKLIEINKEKNHCIPVPDKIIIPFEFEYLNKKINYNAHETNQHINNKYDKLLKMSKDFDELLYKNKNKNKNKNNNDETNNIHFGNDENSKIDFFIQIMKMNETSMEAYYCLSTVLAVVYSIQAKKNIDKYMESDNWLIASLENMIDLVKHQDDVFESNKNNQTNLAIKLSKYIYRIYYCLDKYYKLNKSNNKPQSFDDHYKLSSIIFEGRSTGKFDDISLKKYMSIFGLNKNIKETKNNIFVKLFDEVKMGSEYETHITTVLKQLFGKSAQIGGKKNKKSMKISKTNIKNKKSMKL
jgi:hypothetical protein